MKPGIKPGLQGKRFIHYTTGTLYQSNIQASIKDIGTIPLYIPRPCDIKKYSSEVSYGDASKGHHKICFHVVTRIKSQLFNYKSTSSRRVFTSEIPIKGEAQGI